jgi:hypothetical protein
VAAKPANPPPMTATRRFAINETLASKYRPFR